MRWQYKYTTKTRERKRKPPCWGQVLVRKGGDDVWVTLGGAGDGERTAVGVRHCGG